MVEWEIGDWTIHQGLTRLADQRGADFPKVVDYQYCDHRRPGAATPIREMLLGTKYLSTKGSLKGRQLTACASGALAGVAIGQMTSHRQLAVANLARHRCQCDQPPRFLAWQTTRYSVLRIRTEYQFITAGAYAFSFILSKPKDRGA